MAAVANFPVASVTNLWCYRAGVPSRFCLHLVAWTRTHSAMGDWLIFTAEYFVQTRAALAEKRLSSLWQAENSLFLCAGRAGAPRQCASGFQAV